MNFIVVFAFVSHQAAQFVGQLGDLGVLFALSAILQAETAGKTGNTQQSNGRVGGQLDQGLLDISLDIIQQFCFTPDYF